MKQSTRYFRRWGSKPAAIDARLPLRKRRGMLPVAMAVTCLCSCSQAPIPLPLTKVVEGSGFVRSIDQFVVAALDTTLDAGGTDGKLDFLFVCEAPEAGSIELPTDNGPQKIQVTLNKPEGWMAIRSGDAIDYRCNIVRDPDAPVLAGVRAQAIYYYNFDSDFDLEAGLSELLESIREANQVFTVQDCKAGGVSAASCNNATCGVITGAGTWPCCQPEGNGLCHTVKAAVGDQSANSSCSKDAALSAP